MKMSIRIFEKCLRVQQIIADKIATCAAEEFELNREVISVSIEEVEKDKWPEIYHNEIYGNEETLFVAPKYTVD